MRINGIILCSALWTVPSSQTFAIEDYFLRNEFLCLFWAFITPARKARTDALLKNGYSETEVFRTSIFYCLSDITAVLFRLKRSVIIYDSNKY